MNNQLLYYLHLAPLPHGVLACFQSYASAHQHTVILLMVCCLIDARQKEKGKRLPSVAKSTRAPKHSGSSAYKSCKSTVTISLSLWYACWHARCFLLLPTWSEAVVKYYSNCLQQSRQTSLGSSKLGWVCNLLAVSGKIRDNSVFLRPKKRVVVCTYDVKSITSKLPLITWKFSQVGTPSMTKFPQHQYSIQSLESTKFRPGWGLVLCTF